MEPQGKNFGSWGCVLVTQTLPSVLTFSALYLHHDMSAPWTQNKRAEQAWTDPAGTVSQDKPYPGVKLVVSGILPQRQQHCFQNWGEMQDTRCWFFFHQVNSYLNKHTDYIYKGFHS